MTVEQEAQPYLDACLKSLRWAEERDYTGYSKFDALNSPLLKALFGKIRLARGGVTYLLSRSPIEVRPLLGVRKKQNPAGLALFASTYFNLYRLTGEATHLEKGKALLDALLLLSQGHRYSGHCWGYDHDWEAGVFYLRAYEPNTVVTTFTAQAFMDAYRLTKDKKFLDVAESSTKFLLDDLHVTLDENGLKAYSYTPFDRWTTINTNALLAGLLASVYAETKEQRLEEETRGIVNFLVDRQIPEGGWYHADPPKASHRGVDNYPIAFILASLLRVSDAFGWDDVLWSHQKAIAFYKQHLFLPNGAPMFQTHQVFPHDIVACAQGIITFAQAAHLQPDWLVEAHRTGDWTLGKMLHPSGRFYFQIDRYWTRKYTLMRWCQAWMCFALSELSLASAENSNSGLLQS